MEKYNYHTISSYKIYKISIFAAEEVSEMNNKTIFEDIVPAQFLFAVSLYHNIVIPLSLSFFGGKK